MKKILLILMVVVMVFALAACGGGSDGENDENNAVMQAKLDKAEMLVVEIRSWYEEGGYLDGDMAEDVEALLGTLEGPVEEMKVEHQGILDAGGYTDEDVATLTPFLDNTIAEFNTILEEQAAYDASL